MHPIGEAGHSRGVRKGPHEGCLSPQPQRTIPAVYRNALATATPVMITVAVANVSTSAIAPSGVATAMYAHRAISVAITLRLERLVVQ